MYKAYVTLDSVKATDIDKSMSEFTVRYQTLEKEIALEQARREKAEANRLIFGLVAVIAVLVAVVALLAYCRRWPHRGLSCKRNLVGTLPFRGNASQTSLSPFSTLFTTQNHRPTPTENHSFAFLQGLFPIYNLLHQHFIPTFDGKPTPQTWIFNDAQQE